MRKWKHVCTLQFAVAGIARLYYSPDGSTFQRPHSTDIQVKVRPSLN